MPADSERIEDGLSRRQVLARGAVAAGVIWAAPVIRTATAYATSAAGTERPCTNFYLVCIDPLGVRPVRFPRGLAGLRRCVGRRRRDRDEHHVHVEHHHDVEHDHHVDVEHHHHDDDRPPATRTRRQRPTGSATTCSAEPHHRPRPRSPCRETDTPRPGRRPRPLPGPRRARTAGGAATPEDPHVLAIAAAQGAAAAGAPDNIPPGIRAWMDANPSVPIQYPAVQPMLTQSGDEAWAVLLPPVDGPDPLTHQCRGVKGWAQVKGEYAEFYLDPDPELIDEIGRRMIFPNPRADDLLNDPTLLIENVIFVYCCPQ